MDMAMVMVQEEEDEEEEAMEFIYTSTFSDLNHLCIYCSVEGNFGGRKIWQIICCTTFGEIKFGKLLHVWSLGVSYISNYL